MKYKLHILFFFFIIQLVTVQASPMFAPTWMKPSTYAEYELVVPMFKFLNSTWLSCGEDDTVIFRWECIDLDNTVAELKVSLDSAEVNGGIHLSNVIYVDTLNRSVSLLNGTLIGTTRFWLTANPTENQEIILWDLPPDEIVGVADTDSGSDKPMVTRTPQGFQRMFFVNGNGTINEKKVVFIPPMFDLDTGLMIEGVMNYEALLLALDIESIMGSIKLTNTNIDLGPREVTYDILQALPYVALVIALALILVAIYWQRRKKKKYSKK